jgi:hypothetical protein
VVGTQPIVSSAVWWLMYQLQIHSITLWHRIFKNSVTFFPCISRRKRKEKKRRVFPSLFSPNFWGIRQLLSSKYQFNQLSCLVAIWRPYIWCLIMEGFYDLLLSCSLDVYTSVFSLWAAFHTACEDIVRTVCDLEIFLKKINFFKLVFFCFYIALTY